MSLMLLLLLQNSDVSAQLIDEPRKPFQVKVWQAGAPNSVKVYGDNLYNHQPVITKDIDGSYVVLWTGNSNSTVEGAPGQLIYASRSTDGGDTWSPRFAPFQSSQYTTNPHTSSTEWQPRAARVRVAGKLETWVAYTSGRGSSDHGMQLARKTIADGKFTRFRLIHGNAPGEILSVPADKAESKPTTSSALWHADGRWWFPFPQSIMQLADGTILMTMTMLSPEGSFAAAEKRFAVLRYDGVSWSLSNLALPGEMAATDSWESAIHKTTGGRLIAYIRSNNVRNPRGYRLAVSQSDDGGRTWSACAWAGMPIHTEQPSIASINEKHSVLALPDHTTNRNNQSLILLSEASVTFGLSVSQERDGSEFAHTSDVIFDRERGRLLVVWSQSGVGKAPNEIQFRRIDNLPSESSLNLILRSNAAYELDNSAHTEKWDALSGRLSVIGRGSAGLELPPGVNALHLVVRPGTKVRESVLAVIGTYLHHVAWQLVKKGDQKYMQLIEIRRNGAIAHRRVLKTVPIEKNSEDVQLAIYFDAAAGTVHTFDQELTLEKSFSFFLGDGYLDSKSTPDEILSFDLSPGFISRCLSPWNNLKACAAAQ